MRPKPIHKLHKENYFTFMIPKWSLYLVGMAILIIGIWMGISLEQKDSLTQSNQSSPIFTMSTMDVAKQFACSCGSCYQKNLAMCDCPTAVSTKRFIETNLSAGLDKNEVINMVKKVYGNFKG